MIIVDVFIKEKNWKKYISNPKNHFKLAGKYIEKSIKFLKKKKVNFSVLLTGSSEIKYLNKKFRKKNKSTDVLSFPFHASNKIKKIKNKNIYLGDIVLNFYKIDRKNFKNDFNRLWIHGFLHLLGHKHYKNNDFYKMNRLEKILLKNIKNI
tara:strand:- start:7221 stop:7673 length:453 start_codon:yes stop_codon:yes gene_type:complete